MNSDTKRFITAMVLSLGILVGWQYFFPAPKEVAKDVQEKVVEKKAEQSPTAALEAQAKSVVKKETQTAAIAIEKFTLNNNGFQVIIDSTFRIVDFKNPNQLYPFAEIVGLGKTVVVSTKDAAGYKPVIFAFTQKDDATLLGKSSDGLNIEVALDKVGKLKFNILSDAPKYFNIMFNSEKLINEANQRREYVAYSNDVERFSVGDDEVLDGSFSWFAVDYKYHLFALIFDNKITTRYKSYENGSWVIDFPTATNSLSGSYVFLKKNYDDLKLFGNNLHLSVDFGMFSILAVPLLHTLQWCYKIIPNYGIAIIILTLLVRLLLFPLQHKSAKSMKKMQALQPELKRIKEKYSDDQQRVQKETMELFKRNNANPMGGCLPILLQMPIFFAFYRVLYSAVELVGAPFAFWIVDLSQKDQYFVLPVLMAATMFIQQKMTPSATTDPTQQKIMMAMPLIFGFIMKDLPSGLVLYIFISTLFGIIQQAITYKFSD